MIDLLSERVRYEIILRHMIFTIFPTCEDEENSSISSSPSENYFRDKNHGIYPILHSPRTSIHVHPLIPRDFILSPDLRENNLWGKNTRKQ